MTNSYINIEKARFGDKLQIEFDIDQLLNASKNITFDGQ